jgi:hypothetical protein
VTTADESTVYRDLMRFKPEGLSPNAWALKAGVSRTVWNDMRRHGNPSRRTLEKLLTAAGSSLLEFEALRLGPEQRLPREAAGGLGDPQVNWTPAPLAFLPLVASSLHGEWGAEGSGIEITEIRPGELLDRLARPASLARDPDAYAFTIVGAAMWPRFRTGSRVAVSPRAPVAIGDDVVVRLRPASGAGAVGVQRALVMHLVKRTNAAVELRQFSPERIVQVDADAVEGIGKVIGELI